MNKNEYKKWARGLVFTLITCVLLFQVSNLLRRTAKYGAWNSSIQIGGFKNIEEDTIEVIFYGSSHAYTSFIPEQVEAETGKSAYVFASQQQSIEMSYHFMIETLKTQSPDIMVLETYMTNRSADQPDESIVRSSLDFLPMSFHKLQMINAYAPKGQKHTYYFDLLKYHSRWIELTADDFNFDYKKMIDPLRGFVHLEDIQAQVLTKPNPDPRVNPINEKDEKYLLKIVELAKEKGIELKWVYAPYVIDSEDIPTINGIAKLAQREGIEFVNMMDHLDAIQIDENQDFYDSGHLNVFGARKLTNFYSKEFLK